MLGLLLICTEGQLFLDMLTTAPARYFQIISLQEKILILAYLAFPSRAEKSTIYYQEIVMIIFTAHPCTR